MRRDIFGCTAEASCSCRPREPHALVDVRPTGVHPQANRPDWVGRCPGCGAEVEFTTVNDPAPWAPSEMVVEVLEPLARGGVVIRSGLSVGPYRRATDPGDHVGYAVLDLSGGVVAEAADPFDAARAFVLAELERSEAARARAWRYEYNQGGV